MIFQGRDLKQSVAGSDVAELQTALSQLHYLGDDQATQDELGNQSFGEKTTDAVQLFQKNHSLKPTGIVNTETAAEIERTIVRYTYKVSGNIKGCLPSLIAGWGVDLILVTPGKDVTIASDFVNPTGGYSVSAVITPATLQNFGQTSPDLKVAIYRGGFLVVTSQIIHGAQSLSTLDLLLQADAVAAVSKYTYTVVGNIKGCPPHVIKGWAVTLVHCTPGEEIELGGGEVDENGGYTVSGVITPDTLSKVGQTSPDLKVVMYDGHDAAVLLASSQVAHIATNFSTLDLTLPTGCVYTLSGAVSARGWEKVDGLLVRLVEKNVGRDISLAESVTDAQGNFSLSAVISAAALAELGQKRPDLQVEVFAGGKFLAASEILYDATNNSTIDISLPADAGGKRSEYEALLASVSRVYAGKLADLKDDAVRQDLSYVANKTSSLVEFAAAAHRLSEAVRPLIPGAPLSAGPGSAASGSPSPIQPEFFYALFRAGLPTEADALFQASPKQVHEAWVRAIEGAHIPRELVARIPEVLNKFKDVCAVHSLDAPPQTGLSTLRDMLKDHLSSANDQLLFARMQVEYRDRPGELWTALAETGLAAKVEELRFVGQLHYLTSNNQPLVSALLAPGGNQVASLRDLAVKGFYEPAKWVEITGDAIPKTISGQHADEQRLNYAEMLASEVRRAFPTAVIAQRVARGELPINDTDEVRTALVNFLIENEGQFDITRQSVDDLPPLPHPPSAPDPQPLIPSVRTHVNRLSRVFRLAGGDHKAAAALLKSGLDSAFAITRLGRAAFVRAHEKDLTSREAQDVYARAQQIHGTVLNVAMTYLGARIAPPLGGKSPIIGPFSSAVPSRPAPITPRGGFPSPVLPRGRVGPLPTTNTPRLGPIAPRPGAKTAPVVSPTRVDPPSRTGTLAPQPVVPPGGFPQPVLSPGTVTARDADVPPPRPVPLHTTAARAHATLEGLFGSLDHQDWRECRSILSPAAYLVDLLQRLDVKSPKEGFGNPQTALFKRRPDIQYLPLTCDNTDKALPYIDIVNETLEYFVANEQGLDKFEGYNTDETVSHAELMANPQFVNEAAYEALRKKFFPQPLPFHRPLEMLRLYLQAFGIELPDLMADLRPTESLERNGFTYGWRDILLEQLRISRDEYSLFVESTNVTFRDLFGLSGLPDDHIARDHLSYFQEFSRCTGVSYQDLTAILKTKFINPHAILIPLLEKLHSSFAKLKALKEDSTKAAEFKAGLPGSNFLDARKYGGMARDDLDAVVRWVTDSKNYQRIMEIITVTDVTYEDPHTTSLQLRYSNPDMSANELVVTDFVKLVRFIRLWRKLGLTIQQTDEILTALFPEELLPQGSDDPSELTKLDKGFETALPRIGFLMQVMKRLKLVPDEDLSALLACWAQIGTVGADCLYRRMFLRPSLLQQDPNAQKASPFADDGYGNFLASPPNSSQPPTLLDQRSSLCAAFNLTGEDFDRITEKLAYDYATPLNLDNVTEVFRHGWLSHKLGLSIQEFLQLIRVTGLEPFNSLDPDSDSASPISDVTSPIEPAILRLIRLRQSLALAGIAPVQALYLLWDQDVSGKSAPPIIAGIIELARVLRADFAAADAQFKLVADPDGSIANGLMALIYGRDATDFFFGLLNNTITTSVDYANPAGQANLPQGVIDSSNNRLSYDDLRKQLTYRGVLDQASRITIDKAITDNGDLKPLHQALARLADANHKLIDPFFADYSELQPLYEKYVASSDPVETKRNTLLNVLLPTLKRKRKQEQALASVAAAAGADLGFAAALLQDAGVLTAADKTSSGIADFTAIEKQGLSAQFHLTNDIASAPEQTQDSVPLLSYSQSAGSQLPASRGGQGLIAGVWSGYITAPQDGLYNITVATDPGAHVTLSIGGVTVPLESPITLSATKLTPVLLSASSIKNDLSVSWKSLGRGWEVIPSQYLYSKALLDRLGATYARFLKAVSLATKLSLTPNEFAWLSSQGWLNFLPTIDTPASGITKIGPSLCAMLIQLLDYSRLKRALSPGEERLMSVMQKPQATLPSALESLTGWTKDSTAALLKHFFGDEDISKLASISNFARVYDASAVAKTCRVTGATLVASISNDPTTLMVSNLQSALRASYAPSDWLEVQKPINDTMRIAQRDALVAYVLQKLGEQLETREIDTADKLFEYLLLDVETQPPVQTSRIRLALSSVQLFIERVLRGLEETPPSPISPLDIDASRWTWMKRYRLWQANREVFLWPENWLYPDLRDDQSPFFQQMMSTLLQGDITDDAATTAYLDYLANLEEVAKLEPCGMCYVPATDSTKETTYVVARTAGTHRKYFFRRFEGSRWTPWTEAKIDCEDMPVTPIFWNGRLFLFWLKILKKKQVPAQAEQAGIYRQGDFLPSNGTLKDLDLQQLRKNLDEATRDKDKIRVEAILCWSEFHNDKWQPIKTSDASRPTFIGDYDASGPASFDVDRNLMAIVPVPPPISGVPGESLVLAIQVVYYYKWDPITSRYYGGGFVLHNTHSLPIRAEDYSPKHTIFANITPWSDSCTSRELSPFQSYTGAYTPGVFDIFYWHTWPGNNFRLHNNILGFQTTPRYVDAKVWSLGDDAELTWKAPFLFEDRHFVFFVKATVTSESFRLSQQFGASSPAPSSVALGRTRLTFTYDFKNFFHPYVGDLIGKLNERSAISDMLDPTFIATNCYDPEFFWNSYSKIETSDDGNMIQVTPPRKEIDVLLGGPYASYNWELFYHIPVAIGVHLSKNQRFAEAQKWFHYVFDPTCNDVNDPAPHRFWRSAALRNNPYTYDTSTLLETLCDDNPNISDVKMAILQSYDAMLNNPFHPHLIGEYRPLAYQWFIVMSYLDNLIAWGDSLFLQNTIESLNEATLCYVLASNLLGPRPQVLPDLGAISPQNFLSLRDAPSGLGVMSDAFVDLEGQFPFNLRPNPSGTTGGDPSGALFGIGRSLYFNIPPNPKLLGYWDTVSDRLFKIRNSQNIQGVVQQLPLFDPPLDPGMLVKAAAAGIDIGKIASDLNQPLGPVRAPLLIQRAIELAGEVRSLGSTLLAAMEKGDAEQLAQLRQGQEVNLQQMVQTTRYLQWQHAQEATSGLLRSRASVLERYTYYLRLLGLTPDPDAAPSTLSLDRRELTEDNFDGVYADLVAKYDKPLASQAYSQLRLAQSSSPSNQSGASSSGQLYLNANEDAELNTHLPTARDTGLAASAINATAAILTIIPDINVDLHYWGLGSHSKVFGGDLLATAARVQADVMQMVAAYERDQAGIASRTGTYQRRADEWVLQANLAARELMQIGRQVIGSLIGEQIARYEYETAKKQVGSAEGIQDFLKTKFTNQELYFWLQGEVTSLYYKYYRFACEAARKAERTVKYELMRPELDATQFVQFNYWDSGRKGLMSGEKLHFDLKRMEMAYHDSNKRELELTRHVSLRQLDPVALLSLKVIGTCTVDIPEWLYDLDCPGHYMRRIKSVNVSTPCITGPFTSINCTLSLQRSQVRTSPLLSNGSYARDEARDDDRFLDYFSVTDSIVTSSGTNDSGMFEQNPRDERFLPFEGAGAVSTWKLSLPTEIRSFDYMTISDVILHIRYTARDGGQALAGNATSALKIKLNDDNKPIQMLMLCLPYDFPTQWTAFTNGTKDFVATLRKEHFPYLAQGMNVMDITVQSVKLYAAQSGKLNIVTLQKLNITEISANLKDAGSALVSWPYEDTKAVLTRDVSQQVFLILQYILTPKAS